jgi:hypothetical protein
LEIFLFNLVNAPAGFVVDRRNARMGRSSVESLQSSQKFLKAKLGTKGPKAVNVAHITFRPPPFEHRDEFCKNRAPTAVSTSDFVSFGLLGDRWYNRVV